MTPFDLDVADFGAKGDGKTDDAGALQEAINAAAFAGKCLRLRPRKTYVVSRELAVPDNAEVDGHGAQLITTNEPLRSVLLIAGLVDIRRLTINACHVAQHAALLIGGGQSHFREVIFQGAQMDAVLLSAEGAGNDCVRFEKCVFQHSGRVFTTGSVQVTPGVSPVVTGVGADFTPLRRGDLIHVGTEWLPVWDVLGPDKVLCALHPPSVGHPLGTAYSAHVGDGIREEPNNETNLVVHRDCLYRGNAGSGASFRGLFGARVDNGQSDFNGCFAFTVGVFGNVLISSFRGCYAEGNGASEAFFLGYAAGVAIDTLNCDGIAVRISNPTFNWGAVRNAQGSQADAAIGGYESALPAGVLVVHPTLPPPVPNNYPSGTILFARCPAVGQPLAWQKYGASPYSEWVPFAKRES